MNDDYKVYSKTKTGKMFLSFFFTGDSGKIRFWWWVMIRVYFWLNSNMDIEWKIR